MGYQAPIILLAAVCSLVLAYGWFWWQQKALRFSYPYLVIVVGDQEEYLEGLLRQFLRWCYWYDFSWRLQVVVNAKAKATLAILRQIFYPYPFCWVVYTPDNLEIPSNAQSMAGLKGGVKFLDIRQETNLQSAWGKVYHACIKK